MGMNGVTEKEGKRQGCFCQDIDFELDELGNGKRGTKLYNYPSTVYITLAKK